MNSECVENSVNSYIVRRAQPESIRLDSEKRGSDLALRWRSVRTTIALSLLLAALLSSSAVAVNALSRPSVTGEFSLSIQPTVQYIASGAETTFLILVGSKGGFNSPVDLSTRNVPSGLEATLQPRTVTPPVGGQAYSVLRLVSSSSARTDTYTIEVRGASGTLSKSVLATLIVTRISQFGVLVSPSSEIVAPGGSTRYEVTVTSIGTFSSSVDLDLSAAPGITFSFNPSSLRPTAGKSTTSVLTVVAEKNAAEGTYTLIVEAISKTPDVTQFASATLLVSKVSDFSIAVYPPVSGVVVGESAAFSVAVSSLGGFSSDVTLTLASAPEGVGFSFDPFTVRPNAVTPVTSVLKLTTTIEAKVGTHALLIVGTSDGNVHSASVVLTIDPITTRLTISLSPSSVKQEDTVTVTGTIVPGIAGAVVTLTYTKPGGAILTRAVRTDQDGSYSDSLVPEDVGTWQVTASWQGDATHAAAETDIVMFQVLELSFIERYGVLLGAVAVIALSIAGIVYYTRGKPRQPAEEVSQPPPAGPVRREAPPLILARKRCFNCEAAISAQAKFCDKCRAPQPETVEKKYEMPPLIIPRIHCFNCGEVISAQARFCDKCRAPQP